MRYFVTGLWHFASAMAFTIGVGTLLRGDPVLWLHRAEFTVPLLVASSALFFIPEGLAKKGMLKFLHYPLPDWDVLLLGPASHRHWFTHSPLLPCTIGALAWRYPVLTAGGLPFALAGTGICIGIGSHLFWDCVGSRGHRIVFVPYWVALRPAASRVYLLMGSAISLAVGTLLVSGHMDALSKWIAQRH